MSKSLFLMGLWVLLSGCNKTTSEQSFVPVIGLNAQGKSELKTVPVEVFQQTMSPYVGEMSEEISTTLDREANLVGTPWTLSRVSVGLALEAETDLFDVVEAEAHGDIELRFQKMN